MTYCLIVPDFRGIGGAQLYALRRMKYLAKKGIDSVIAVGLLDQKILDETTDVKVFQHELINDLAFDVKKGEKIAVIKKLIDWCRDEITIIETYDPVGATWGECLAFTLNCKHVIYSLIEPEVYKNIQDRPILDFFKFKLSRDEFIGLSSVSLEKIFNRKFSNTENRYVNVPFDDAELPDNSAIDINKYISHGAFVIGTVSRLEKGYVEELIKATVSFSRSYTDNHFVLIIAGDSEVGNYKQEYLKKYAFNKTKQDNLEIFLPGYMRPLGKDFFNKIDLFIGMGTGAVSAISQGCATIVIDPINNKSSGIFGVDTNNFAYSESGVQYSILDSIKDVYKNNNRFVAAKKAGRILFEKQFDVSVCMKKLDNYIYGIEDFRNEYWNVNNIGLQNTIIRYIYRNRKHSVFKMLNQMRKRIVVILSKCV